ncbi:CBS domain-containing protein [Octadecabacter arcticus]|nr:CBS domain-containing protein [Octadecabacter arcticus]
MAFTALDIVESKHTRLGDVINNERMVGQLTLSETDSVSFAIRVFSKGTSGLLAVVDEARKLIGLLSERDIIRALAEDGRGIVEWPVSRVMKRELSVATQDTYCTDTLLLMIEKHFRHMPVVDDDGTFIACVDALQVAYAKISEMTDSNRKLMRLMAVFTDQVIDIATSDSIETIRAMFAEKDWVSAVVKDDQKVVGFITADELLRFSCRIRAL